jgi:hypothetical protein
VPAVYQLLGYPGTGKYTVARAIVEQLAARGEPAALLDNHATANLVWSLVTPERRFDADVMARVAELRAVLWDAAAELTGPAHSLILTNFLPLMAPTVRRQPSRRQTARVKAASILATAPPTE